MVHRRRREGKFDVGLPTPLVLAFPGRDYVPVKGFAGSGIHIVLSEMIHNLLDKHASNWANQAVRSPVAEWRKGGFCTPFATW